MASKYVSNGSRPSIDSFDPDQTHLLHIQSKIRDAGEMPAHLKEALDAFISEMKQSFYDAQRPVPDLLYVQLVDHAQRRIRTVRGFGLPLSFEFLPAHSLDSKDIQADIVKNRKVEIIAGNDLERFDQRVFKQYHHEDYVRLWMPLFPFPQFMENDHDTDALLMKALRDHLILGNEKEEVYKNGEKMLHRVAQWKKEIRPPEGLVFGTLEVGYKLNKNGERSDYTQYKETKLHLSTPFDNDFIFWCIAKAFRLSNELFLHTLSGSIEQIGRLLISIAPGLKVSITTSLTPGPAGEVRNYPASSIWGAAVPRTLPEVHGDDQKKQVTLKYKAELQNKIRYDKTYLTRLSETMEAVVKQAIEVASHLFRAAIYPQELLVLDYDPSYMGTLVEDKDVLFVCEEAAIMTGATSSMVYFFQAKAFPRQEKEQNEREPWLIRPPTIWGNKHLVQRFEESIKKMAKEVVKYKVPIYPERSKDKMDKLCICLLPLEFSQNETSVLVLLFDKEKYLSNIEKRNLEQRVPRWVYRLYINQLILRNRFSALTAQLRKDIVNARSKVLSSNNLHSDCVTEFIREVLKSTITRQGLPVGWLTLESTPKTGPCRVERFWFLNKKEKSDEKFGSYTFINAKLSGPCKEACEKKRPVIYSGKKKNKKLAMLLDEFNKEKLRSAQAGDTKKATELLRFIDHICHEQKASTESSTVLTFPVLKRSDAEPSFRAAYTFVLSGNHYYDGVHRAHLIELGGLLAEALDQVRQRDKTQSEDRFLTCLDELQQEFGTAKTIDDIVGALLRGKGPGDGETATLKLTQDAVFWVLSHNGEKLVARSGRGCGLEVLLNPSKNMCDVVSTKQHPLWKKLELKTEKANERPRIKRDKPTLWTIPIDKQKRNKILNAYASTGYKWLVTFPIVDATARIVGIVDYLCNEPLSIVEEETLPRLMQRISFQFSSARMNCHFKMVRRITRELFEKLEQILLKLAAQEIHQRLVQYLKGIFYCAHCDLFIEQDGRMLLHATTRKDGPKEEKERFNFEVRPIKSGAEILGTCLKTGEAIIRHAGKKTPPAPRHLSDRLQKMLSEDFKYEQMVIPLSSLAQGAIGQGTRPIGLIHLVRLPSNQIGSQKLRKRNYRFTAEELSFGIDLILPIQNILRMANLVEQQRWLFNQLVHSLGQPLQVLRSATNDAIRALYQTQDKATRINIKELMHKINTGFDMVHAAKERLGFFTRVFQTEIENVLIEVNLKQLIKECCDQMSMLTATYGTRIDYTKVLYIKPVPAIKPWIRTALINLLDNAVKYSWKGRKIKIAAHETAKGTIVIQVKNWGVGIPREDQERIFEPYYRSKVPDARGSRSGTGVGLAIVLEAIEGMHKGRVYVSSGPWRHKKLNLEGTLDEITNVEYETTFCIVLWRQALENMKKREMEVYEQ